MSNRKNLTRAQVAEHVDSFVDAQMRVKAAEGVLREAKENLAKIQEPLEKYVDLSVDASEGLELASDTYSIKVGPKAKKTKVTNLMGILEILGKENFLKIATVSIKGMKEYMDPQEIEEVSEVGHEGARRFSIQS